MHDISFVAFFVALIYMFYSKQDHVFCTDCKNNKCFIKSCSRKWQQYANKHRVIQLFQKEQQIIVEGSVVSGLYFISCGKVKVSTSWGAARSKILRFSKSGNMIGYMGFDPSYQYYTISVTAKEDTKTCFFGTAVLYNLMRNNPQLAVCLIKFYTDDLIKTDIYSNINAQKSVRERMAFALMELYHTFGKKENGHAILDIKISRQEMAEYAETTPENVSKFLHEFSDDGFIAVKGQNIEVLNPEQLHNISNLKGYKILNNGIK